MTTPVPPIPDEELLRRAFRLDNEGYLRFLELESSDRITEFPTERGPVVVVDGKKLHSGRDPVREAMRFVRGLNIAEATRIVLYGYGSGYVARALHKKTDATLFVYEPCLEALHWGITHGEVPDNVVFLTSPVAVKTVLYAQLSSGDRGQLVPWQPSVRIDNVQFLEVRQELEMAVHRAKIRALTAELRGDGWLNFFLENLPRVLEGPSLGALQGTFQGVPAVICSAGPSLAKQLPLLKTIADDVLILCVNTAIGALHKAGIEPNGVVAVESADLSSMFEGIDTLNNINGLMEITGNPNQLAQPFRRLIPICTENTTCSRFLYALDPRAQLSGGFCVANTAFAVAHKLGCGPIILIGQDLAYANGRMYSEGTIFEGLRTEVQGDKAVVFDDGSKQRILESSQDAIRGKPVGPAKAEREVAVGWAGVGEVESTADFLMFRDWFSRSAVRLRGLNIECVNCTEGGLTIPEWDEISFQEAIERYVTPVGSKEPTIRQRFNDLADQDGFKSGQLLEALRTEIADVARIRAISAKAQVLVNFDPEGDLRAPEPVQLELAAMQEELAEILQRASIAADALSRPLESLHIRRELNLFAIHKAIEETLEPLASDLDRLEQRLAALG